jgi:sec-independent protein translocase protein TatA
VQRAGTACVLAAFTIHLVSGGFPLRLGLPELLMILVVALLIWGPKNLPALGKGLGDSIKNFKDALKDDDPKKPQ